MQSPAESEIRNAYTEIERPMKQEAVTVIVFLVAALLFGLYVFHVLVSSVPSQRPIIIGAILLGLFMVLVYSLLDRCPRCRSRPIRITSSR